MFGDNGTELGVVRKKGRKEAREVGCHEENTENGQN